MNGKIFRIGQELHVVNLACFRRFRLFLFGFPLLPAGHFPYARTTHFKYYICIFRHFIFPSRYIISFFLLPNLRNIISPLLLSFYIISWTTPISRDFLISPPPPSTSTINPSLTPPPKPIPLLSPTQTPTTSLTIFPSPWTMAEFAKTSLHFIRCGSTWKKP